MGYTMHVRKCSAPHSSSTSAIMTPPYITSSKTYQTEGKRQTFRLASVLFKFLPDHDGTRSRRG